MDPKLIQRLLENPDVRELQTYIQMHCLKLKDLTTVRQTAPQGDIALEVIARERAYDTLLNILQPFIDPQSTPSPVDPSEYVV